MKPPERLVDRAKLSGYVLMRQRDYDRAVCLRSHSLRNFISAIAAQTTLVLLSGFVVGLVGGLLLAVFLGWGWQ
jgi:hypothetical protein